MSGRDDTAVLDALNAGYIRAVQDADVRWFEEHLSPDFLNSNPDGSLVERKAFLGRIARSAGISGVPPTGLPTARPRAAATPPSGRGATAAGCASRRM